MTTESEARQILLDNLIARAPEDMRTCLEIAHARGLLDSVVTITLVSEAQAEQDMTGVEAKPQEPAYYL